MIFDVVPPNATSGVWEKNVYRLLDWLDWEIGFGAGPNSVTDQKEQKRGKPTRPTGGCLAEGMKIITLARDTGRKQ